MHTPRLCIDGRAAAEYQPSGILAQELIDQLVASQGERAGDQLTCDWMEKRRTVLLTHPKQIFSGQLRRFDTKRRIGLTPFAWMWERHFVKEAQLSAFHRFRPASRLAPIHRVSTITTVLPARSSHRANLKNTARHRFVVPSKKDGEELLAKGASAQSIHVFPPVVRRYLAFASAPAAPGTRILLLTGPGEKFDTARIQRHLQSRFPGAPLDRISLKDREALAPQNWAKKLSQARLVVYLSARSFDWPIFAVEALYWKVPLVFLDGNRALSELFPDSPMSLSRFLIHQTSDADLALTMNAARKVLEEKGIFDPLHLAKKYRDLYETLERTVD